MPPYHVSSPKRSSGQPHSRKRGCCGPRSTRNAGVDRRGYDAAVTRRLREWLAAFDLPSRAAALSVASNALLMALKLSFGLIFGSVALLGDGIDSAEDVLASGLAFFTVRLALQPADEAHPYGHGKAESLAALSQAGLIGGGAVFIAVAAVLRMVHDDTEIHVAPSLVAAGITAAVNLGVAAYALRAGRISG